ncbi:4269_t:CDS:1, partial [Funneliformis mosseae]
SFCRVYDLTITSGFLQPSRDSSCFHPSAHGTWFPKLLLRQIERLGPHAF